MKGRALLLFPAVLASCTPLGLWIYEDPAVTIADLRINTDQGTAAPASVVLALENRNDYSISVVRVAVMLRLNDADVGGVTLDTTLQLPQDEKRRMRLSLTAADSQARVRVTRLGPGLHRYAVEGRAILDTPLGERRMRFREEGAGAFGRALGLVPGLR